MACPVEQPGKYQDTEMRIQEAVLIRLCYHVSRTWIDQYNYYRISLHDVDELPLLVQPDHATLL